MEPIGRQIEQELIDRALDIALQQAMALVIEGEAGIGWPQTPPSAVAPLRLGHRLFATAQCNTVAAHKGLCADALHAMNGPHENKDPHKYLAGPHDVHLNQRGHHLVADLLMKLGLAPLELD